MSSTLQRNPHFDDDRVVWNDTFSGQYHPVRYHEQFDEQWKLFLERKPGFHKHTGVETANEYIDDRIREITGVEDYLLRKRWGPLSKIVKRVSGRGERAARRGIGGRLYLEPKFSIDHFQGKRCLDIGCGAGRWTKTLVSLGARVKAMDVSEQGLKSTRRFTSDTEYLDLFDIIPKREDLHAAFDFTLCWGVIMCTHDPRLAFENVASTVKRGGQLYCMVYAPTYHASEFVLAIPPPLSSRAQHAEERSAFIDELTANDRENAINYQDMLNTFYNWTINEATLEGWCSANGFSKPVFLNAAEPHKGAHHILARKL